MSRPGFVTLWSRLALLDDCINTALDRGDRRIFRRACRERTAALATLHKHADEASIAELAPSRDWSAQPDRGQMPERW